MVRLLTTTILMAMFLLAGCSTQPVEKVGADKKQEQEESKQVFKIGDIVKVGDNQLIIKSAKLGNGDPFFKPKKGKALILEIEAHNKGGQSWLLNDLDFNLYDASGQKMEHYYFGDVQSLTGEINQGKSLTGKIAFDVQEADSYELIYKPDSFTNQEIKFNIVPSKQ